MTTQPSTNEPIDQSSLVSADSTKEYQVQNMSNWSVFIFVLAAPLSFALAVGIASGFDGGAVMFIAGIAASVLLMIYLYHYLQQTILVTVGQGSINIHYLRSPFFVSTSDMDLVPEDVESYKYDIFNGARFVLYMKDGRRFRAAVGRIGKTETIEQMSKHIIALITDKHYSPAVTSSLPRRRTTYAEGTTGLVLAILVILIMIAMGIGITFFSENHNTSDTVRGIGIMFPCLAFVLYVFNLRRKARKEKEEQTGGNSGS
jgi:hypothetical protein